MAKIDDAIPTSGYSSTVRKTLLLGGDGTSRVTSANPIPTTATISGDVNVDSNSNDVTGLVGKASGTNADFTTAYASATTITLSNLPSGINKIVADDIVSIQQIATDGSVTNTYTRDDITLTASGTDPTTLTISGASFINTDTFVVYTNIRSEKAYDSSNDAKRNETINPLWSHDGWEKLADVTNETNATNNRPIDMEGYDGLIIQFEVLGGTDTVTLTINGSVQNDGTAFASINKQDITQYGFGIVTAATTAASYTADAMLYLLDGTAYKYIDVQTVSAGGANDGDYAIYYKKWKR